MLLVVEDADLPGDLLVEGQLGPGAKQGVLKHYNRGGVIRGPIFPINTFFIAFFIYFFVFLYLILFFVFCFSNAFEYTLKKNLHNISMSANG